MTLTPQELEIAKLRLALVKLGLDPDVITERIPNSSIPDAPHDPESSPGTGKPIWCKDGIPSMNDLPPALGFLKPAMAKMKLGELIFEENPYTREAATMLVRLAPGIFIDDIMESISNEGELNLDHHAPPKSPLGQRIPRLRDRLKDLHREVPMELVEEENSLGSQLDSERSYTETTWEFKGLNYSVSRAVRVPYCFTDAYGRMVEEYVLLGYEGSGGYG